TGAELMILPNGSPYSRDKDEVRLNIAVARVTESGVPLIYVNQIGGQDELVFDGASFALHADRGLAFQLPAFREIVETTRWERTGNGWRCVDGRIAAIEEGDKADYFACMLGLRDYVGKIGCKGVVLGLSGGIDSSLVATLAVDALGAERVHCIMLMAVSSRLGLIVVTTGNKSEMSVGYATLYGDMNGGFNPVKDLYKTEVYRLARLRNGWKPDGALGPAGPVIPDSILTRAPSAELRENQTDQDTLPPYDVLDQILERLVEREESIAKIVAEGFDRDTVMKVERMLHLAEYKRRQAAPGA